MIEHKITEMINSRCSDLICMVRDKFLSDDIDSLIIGFLRIELIHAPEIIASAIEYALITQDIQRYILERYLENVHETARKEIPCQTG
jgi:hypothetical protein